jgi:hypothetical protein
MNPEEEFRDRCIATYKENEESELTGGMGILGLCHLFTLPLTMEQQIAYVAKIGNTSVDEVCDAFSGSDEAKKDFTDRIFQNVKDRMQKQEEQHKREKEECRNKYMTMLECESDPEIRRELEWRLEILIKIHKT